MSPNHHYLVANSKATDFWSIEHIRLLYYSSALKRPRQVTLHSMWTQTFVLTNFNDKTNLQALLNSREQLKHNERKNKTWKKLIRYKIY